MATATRGTSRPHSRIDPSPRSGYSAPFARSPPGRGPVMRRKTVLIAVGIVVTAVAVVVGVLGLLLKSEPEFYAAPDAANGSEAQAQSSAMLVTRVQDLKNDIRSKSEWGAEFRTDDLNSFFGENLSQGGGLTGVLPKGCHSP